MLIFGADFTVGGTVISPIKGNSFVGSITDPHEKLRMIASEQYNSLWIKAIHRDLFVRRDYRDCYHIFIGEDLIQSFDPVYWAKKLTVIGDRLYNYEQNPAGITHQLQGTKHVMLSSFRSIIHNFLEETPCWDEADRAWYRRTVRTFISNEVRQIGYERSTRKEKYRLWNALQNDSFYRPYLDTLEVDRAVDRLALWLLQHRFYFVLYFIYAVRVMMLNTKQKKI